ncbi:MAG: TRAP transporter small permease [Rhodobacter sp.]|nr:TRAP transporter small permease [Paracoccaceae bacterium]MCB1409609.1 TRAP transporter small permease [Paracoccaceae bacterium]MCC0079658.1 TRAP transporter small permease [Rhodobacter sp.]
MFKTIHSVFYRIAWWMAVVGGALLTLLVLMLCVSIIGRTASTILHSDWMQTNMAGLANWLIDIGVGPIFGDYEFLTAGLAICIFCFIGWCQITGGHATVDVFTAGLSDRSRRRLQMVLEILFAIALVLIAVQLYEGMSTYIRRRSTTFLLQYPLWWNYLLALIPAVITAVIGVYMAVVRTIEALTDRPLVVTEGAEH